jgi:hypothetical protein
MNSQKLELVTRGILERTSYDHKKAHRLALAALSGKPCPECDDTGLVHKVEVMGGSFEDVCPVCVSVEDARQ